MNMPNAATNSLSAAITASDFQNGSTYAGTLNGEKTADWRVGQERPAGHEVRVPERHVGQHARA